MSNYTVKLEGIRSRKRTKARREAKGCSAPTVEPTLLPQIYNTEQAAQYLGISPDAVLYRLKKGLLPGRKHGGRWVIRAIDLAQFVEPNNLHLYN
jgi:excisionase family DNA binding protein